MCRSWRHDPRLTQSTGGTKPVPPQGHEGMVSLPRRSHPSPRRGVRSSTGIASARSRPPHARALRRSRTAAEFLHFPDRRRTVRGPLSCGGGHEARDIRSRACSRHAGPGFHQVRRARIPPRALRHWLAGQGFAVARSMARASDRAGCSQTSTPAVRRHEIEHQAAGGATSRRRARRAPTCRCWCLSYGGYATPSSCTRGRLFRTALVSRSAWRALRQTHTRASIWDFPPQHRRLRLERPSRGRRPLRGPWLSCTVLPLTSTSENRFLRSACKRAGTVRFMVYPYALMKPRARSSLRARGRTSPNAYTGSQTRRLHTHLGLRGLHRRRGSTLHRSGAASRILDPDRAAAGRGELRTVRQIERETPCSGPGYHRWLHLGAGIVWIGTCTSSIG